MKQYIIKLKNAIKVTSIGRYIMTIRREKKGKSVQKATQVLDKFYHGHEKKRILEDMLSCSQKYRLNYEEYFLYNFENKSDAERKQFISDSERVTICELFNQPKNQIIFDDKGETAKTFKKFFGRQTAVFRGSKDIDSIREFLLKHKRCIAKPLTSACGYGVKVINVNDEVDKIAHLLITNYCSGLSSGGILEELIIQAEPMVSIHSQSVNTVRIPTVRLDDRVEIFQPFFRAGRGESIVDNGGAGGIICALDEKTGKVIAAKDEKCQKYIVHPDTNFPLIGFTIPEWDKAVEFVEQLVQVVPSNRYTAWDLAYTSNGYVLVEANARGQFLSQIPLEYGFRSQVMQYFKELNINYNGKVEI